MKRSQVTSDVRQRILETATRLFYQHGIRAIGVDRIIAEAGVAKMSLYKHFASKDDLILAALTYHEKIFLTDFAVSMERHSKRKKDKLLGFFAALHEWFERPEYRGCAFQNATIELAEPGHAGTQFVREHKLRFQAFLKSLIAESLGKAAAKHAPAVSLLVEGAIIIAVIQGSPDAIEVARDAALKLLALS